MTDDRYPHTAGHRGIGGSVEAAEIMTPKLPHLQSLVLSVIEARGGTGATGDEIAAALGWDKYRVRPRTAELRKLGRIFDSRQRRRSEAGVASIVWVGAGHTQPLTIAGAA